MSCENIFKDFATIHARLFHHKPALQGHINFFLKEFEERRGEREGLRMNSTYKNMSYIQEQGLPNSTEALQQCVANLKESVDSATAQCQEICDREGKTSTQEEEASFLSTEHERRTKEWNDFIGLQCERSATVDEEYESQIEALRTHYSDLENKLRSKVVL
ncbi:biogenesis of lysosome-related organelles complex 1 subunit 5-like [Haliotis rubra]|uniref:biogenesis of lysosome-related organelles complex 1 subunit 5-like n=1 Tax=Haliotis rubra TaxID=36100 RepID=UPI001EE62460|nr:biogenesis of lysosome-related organelles complex 1 subunit 5-like [Haliotis rubra]